MKKILALLMITTCVSVEGSTIAEGWDAFKSIGFRLFSKNEDSISSLREIAGCNESLDFSKSVSTALGINRAELTTDERVKILVAILEEKPERERGILLEDIKNCSVAGQYCYATLSLIGDVKKRAYLGVAADAGYMPAQYELGLMLRDGRGGYMQKCDAMDQFWRCAAQGNAECGSLLREMKKNFMGNC